MQPQSPGIHFVFRSHLKLESYTAEKLATILKKLNAGKSNNKSKRLESLKAYFNARDDEIKQCIGADYYGSSKFLGIEIVLKNDTIREVDNICVLLKGGKKIVRSRNKVCESKYSLNDEKVTISLMDISESEAKSAVEKLYPKEKITGELGKYIGKIDSRIDELQKYQKQIEANPCRFVFIHDLF